MGLRARVVVVVAGWLAFAGPAIAADADHGDTTRRAEPASGEVGTHSGSATPGYRSFASRGLSKAIGTDLPEPARAATGATATVEATDEATTAGKAATPTGSDASAKRPGEPTPQLILAASPGKPEPSAPPSIGLKPGLPGHTEAAPASKANPGGNATQPVPPQASPQPTTVAPAGPTAAWPKTLPEAKAEAEAKANPQAVATQWPQADIDLAHARCTAILKGVDAVTIPEASMRHGECGAPAPVRLVSIGRNPEVSLSPPAVMTCDMVVAMHNWVKSDLQPLAKKHLGAAIIKIETMSDYSCRNAYGRTRSKLSEHGRANALDIRGFTTAKGEATVLLDHWGPTARDIAAQVAAARQAAEKLAQEKAAAEKAAQLARANAKGKPGETGSTTGNTTTGSAVATGAGAGRTAGDAPAGLGTVLRDGATTLSDGLPRVTITVPGIGVSTDRPRDGNAFSDPPSRLGGAKPAAAAPSVAAAPLKDETSRPGAADRDPASSKSRFLREAHAAACRIFGTTLGPEANNAHRNHFHVDMAERRSKNICE